MSGERGSMGEAARPARLEIEGRVLALTEADVARIEERAAGMPGLRWSATYLRARYAHPDAPEPAAMALAAAALGVDSATLRSRLAGAGAPLLRAAEATVDGRTFRVAADELEAIDTALSQGSWKVADVYAPMKARTGSVDAALALTAQLLGSTVEQVRGTLEWHDQYMRWHDGDPSYSIF